MKKYHFIFHILGVDNEKYAEKHKFYAFYLRFIRKWSKFAYLIVFPRLTEGILLF